MSTININVIQTEFAKHLFRDLVESVRNDVISHLYSKDLERIASKLSDEDIQIVYDLIDSPLSYIINNIDEVL